MPEATPTMPEVNLNRAQRRALKHKRGIAAPSNTSAA